MFGPVSRRAWNQHAFSWATVPFLDDAAARASLPLGSRRPDAVEGVEIRQDPAERTCKACYSGSIPLAASTTFVLVTA
jgi:hypothetical protein